MPSSTRTTGPRTFTRMRTMGYFFLIAGLVFIGYGFFAMRLMFLIGGTGYFYWGWKMVDMHPVDGGY